MDTYYRQRPRTQAASTGTPTQDPQVEGSKTLSSEFDRYRQQLVDIDDDEGRASELRRYIKDQPADVTKNTNIVTCWQVSQLITPVKFLS